MGWGRCFRARVKKEGVGGVTRQERAVCSAGREAETAGAAVAEGASQ